MSLDLENKCKTFLQNNTYTIGSVFPAYIDINGEVQLALANNEQSECFGVCTVLSDSTLLYCSEKRVYEVSSHGFTPGKILYLQDDGSLEESPGSFTQKICEVLDGNCLMFLGQPMYSNTESVSGVARIPVSVQTVNNVGSALNNLLFDTPEFDTIGLTVSGNLITLPSTAFYDVMLVINTFDNNSPRVAHRIILNIDGVEYSRLEGENYMRDASGHDSSSIKYPEIVKTVTNNQVIDYQVQTHSVLTNTTDITSGWLIIKQL